MENNENTSINTADENSEEESTAVLSPEILMWGVATFVMSIVWLSVTASPKVLVAGFFAKFFTVIIGTVLGTLGVVIGDAIRRFAHPDAVYTTGGFFDIIKTKLFWMCGPQLIGMIIGIAIAQVLVIG